MPQQRTLNATWAEWICEVLEEHSIDTRPILKDLQIRRAELTKTDPRIVFSKFAALLNRAAVAMNDPYIGLHLGSQIDFRRAGLLAYIMLNTPTLGHAFVNCSRYNRVHGDVVDIIIEKDKKVWKTANHFLDPETRNDPLIIDIYLAADLKIARTLTDEDLAPVEVHLSYPEPKEVSEHRRIFGCPLRFGTKVSAIIFEAATFDLPVKDSDDRLLKILEGYAEEILAKLSKPASDPVLMQTREIIAHYLPTDIKPTIERVASDLHMSVRTLSRRLSQNGITFRELVDSLRRSLAERYLRDQQIGLAQIAFLVGYSDQATLNRSFHRWTGKTPSQFRKEAV